MKSMIPRKNARAFTLVELLLSAMITALVASASAALVSAVSSAVVSTKDSRQVKNCGNYLLGRIASTVRESRAVGSVTSTTISLWLDDTNGDDTANLNETGIIRYDSSTQKVSFENMQTSATALTTTQLTNVSTLSSLITGTDKKSVVWGDGVTSCTFDGYPSTTETRIVQARFFIGSGADATAFQTTASPKGGGDYLFNTSAKEKPNWAARQVRSKKSVYGGISTAP
jgi:type II secretory pathway pseudopilin PulG